MKYYALPFKLVANLPLLWEIFTDRVILEATRWPEGRSRKGIAIASIRRILNRPSFIRSLSPRRIHFVWLVLADLAASWKQRLVSRGLTQAR